jgi:hypothetical protein
VLLLCVSQGPLVVGAHSLKVWCKANLGYIVIPSADNFHGEMVYCANGQARARTSKSCTRSNPVPGLVQLSLSPLQCGVAELNVSTCAIVAVQTPKLRSLACTYYCCLRLVGPLCLGIPNRCPWPTPNANELCPCWPASTQKPLAICRMLAFGVWYHINDSRQLS